MLTEQLTLYHHSGWTCAGVTDGFA